MINSVFKFMIRCAGLRWNRFLDKVRNGCIRLRRNKWSCFSCRGCCARSSSASAGAAARRRSHSSARWAWTWAGCVSCAGAESVRMSRFLQSRCSAWTDYDVLVLSRRIGNCRIRSTVFGCGVRSEVGACFWKFNWKKKINNSGSSNFFCEGSPKSGLLLETNLWDQFLT